MRKSKVIMKRALIASAFLAVLILLAGLTLAGNASERALAANEISNPTVIGPFYPAVFNGSLLDLPRVEGGESKGEALPPPRTAEKASPPTVPGWVDPLAQTQFGAGQMPDPIMNFAGLERPDGGGWIPPDTNGDVGPNHYIETVNIALGIYDKATGAELVNMTFDALFDGTGTSCDNQNRGDPIVLYDHLADRWLITDFSLPAGGPYRECIAVSQTGDPVNGGWYFYALDAGNDVGSWHDYPKLGVWPDAYYMSANMFDPWAGAKVWALDRAAMINGDPLTAVTFDVGTAYASLLPANLEGPEPPVGAPNYFASIAGNDLQLWQFHVDWATPGNSTLTGPVELPVEDYDYIGDIPQPAPGNLLDSLGDRLMMQLQYRNYGDHEALFVNHTVASGGAAGVRWYEVRDPNNATEVYQQGTYQPDDTYRWMGSIAADGDGNLALGYSVSSTTLKPGIRYTGRLAGESLGTLLQGEASLIEGTGVQVGASRWGDYSTMTIDPVDDCTFWYTQEYYITNGSTWQTRIGSFRFPSCGVPKGWIEGVVYDDVTLEGIPNVWITAESLTTTLTVETDSTGYYTMTLPGETYTLTAGPLPPAYLNPTVIENVALTAGQVLQLDIPLSPSPVLVEDTVTITDNPPTGNGNGYAEPGESQLILTEAISNTGPITATNVTAQLIALTPGVTVTVDTSDYPDIPAGTSQVNLSDFVFSISPDLPCGTQLDFMKLISTDQSPFTVTFSLYASVPLPEETLFFDDMENGAGNWMTGGINNHWAISTEDSHSPTHAWSDSPGGVYFNNANSWVRAPIFDLTNMREFTLSFWHKYDTEANWDFGYAEYSVNGGVNWEALDSYTGRLDTWTQESFDIPAFDGDSNASFRFRLQSDGSVVEDGWHIDDVRLSYIPFQCTFPIEAPATPVLVAPSDGTITTTHTTSLEWMPGEGEVADEYELELDGEVYTTTDTSYTTTLDAGLHTWSVRASNVWGYSAPSAIWSFEIIDPAGAPELVSPADAAILLNPVTFEWSPSAAGSPADGFIFFLDETEVMTFTAATTSIEMTLNLGEHTWSVSAFNFAGTTPSDETRSLTVIEEVPEVYYWVFLPLAAKDN